MDIAQAARESRAKLAQAGTETREIAPNPYADVTEPQPIPGTRRVALVVRDTRSNALYVCSRGESGSGAKRVHMDVLSTLGFVHIDDTETLADAGFVPKPEPPAPKTTAKKASDSK